MRRFLSVAATTVALVALAASPASAAPSSTNVGAFNVCNDSLLSDLGVFHAPDGSYTTGKYDLKLRPGQCTRENFGWPATGGWYIAGGWCVVVGDKDYRYIETEPAVRPGPEMWKFPNNIRATYHVMVGVAAPNGNCSVW
jgi:hypothetical protein